MVSRRCKIFVAQQLGNLGITPISIDFGVVELDNDLSPLSLTHLKRAILGYGLEVMDNENAVLIENIKKIITDTINYSEGLSNTNFSD